MPMEQQKETNEDILSPSTLVTEEDSNVKDLQKSEDEKLEQTLPKLSICSPTFEVDTIAKEIISNGSTVIEEGDCTKIAVNSKDSSPETNIEDEAEDEISSKPAAERLNLNHCNQGSNEEARRQGMEEDRNQTEDYETPCQETFMICFHLFKFGAYTSLLVFFTFCILWVINKE